MSTEIHDKIRSEVERRLAIARAATPGPWEHVAHGKDGEFMGCGAVTTWGEGVEGGDIAAPSGDCYPRGGYSPREDMAHIALHDPADAIRRYEYALKVLDRHKFNGDQPYGAGDECLCIDDWPCVEITDLAESLGIDTGGTDG